MNKGGVEIEHNDKLIKINMDQADNDNEILMGLTTSLKQSGIIVELISELYDEKYWNSRVEFIMKASDLYKIPNIVDEQIVITAVDEEYTTGDLEEVSVTIYNDYLE